MGTKNNPGKFDCYAAAQPDEPMFVLLARDRHMPALVWIWASLRELDGEDPEKVTEARDCAQAAVEWAYFRGRRSVGFGQVMLASAFDLIRFVNHAAAKEHKNLPTDTEVVRRMLAMTEFEAYKAPSGPTAEQRLATVAALAKALEAHHIAQNKLVNRDPAKSKTLSLIREMLAAAGGPQ